MHSRSRMTIDARIPTTGHGGFSPPRQTFLPPGEGEVGRVEITLTAVALNRHRKDAAKGCMQGVGGKAKDVPLRWDRPGAEKGRTVQIYETKSPWLPAEDLRYLRDRLQGERGNKGGSSHVEA